MVIQARDPRYNQGMRAWAVWILVGAAGCIDRGQFLCSDDVQCLAPQGRCIAGSCVLDDEACPHGRYSEYAAPALAGRCYEPDDLGSTGSDPTTTSSTSAAGSTTIDAGLESSSEGDSSTGAPVPVELCNGIDDDGNGLVDEWSPQNTQCEICPEGASCRTCDLFPDDPQAPTRVYFLCDDGGYSQMVGFCAAIGAPPVSIHDDAENIALAIKTTELTPYNKAYIGARDFGEPGRSAWMWIDGSTFEYERLGDDLSMHEAGDVCVMINGSGSWTAVHPNGGQPFICEAPLP